MNLATLDRLRRGLAGLAFALAVAAICGWTLGLDPLTAFVSGWATQKMNTALAIAALAAALWVRAGRARALGAWLAALVAAASLFEEAAGIDLGIDELLVADPDSVSLGLPPGRMAVATAMGLLLASAGVLAARRWPTAAQAAGAAAFAVGWVALVGYAAELGPLSSVSWYGSVSVPTALALCLLGAGAFLVEPAAGCAAGVTGADAGASLLRQLGPAAVLFPPLASLLSSAVSEQLGLQPGFGMASAVTLDTAVFLLLLAAVAERTRREEHARSVAVDGLRASEQRQAELSRALLRAQEAERRQLAVELHDELGQGLTGLALLVDRAAGDPRAANDARTYLSQLIEQVRSMALQLRPSLLDDLGLLPAVEWLVGRYPGLTVELAVLGDPRRYPAELETAAFRIVQEGLTNVVRHAGTERAEVRLLLGEDQVRVEVSDSGVGLSAAPRTGPSSGLSGMRERAAALGGTVALARDGGRTTLTAILPVPGGHR